MGWLRGLLFTTLLLAGLAPRPVAALEGSLSLKPEFSTGTYGGSSRTTLFEAPVKFRIWEPDWGLGIRLPFLREAGTQAVVPGLGPVGPVLDEPAARAGLGNIRLSAWGNVWRHAETGFALDIAGEIAPPGFGGPQSMSVGFTRAELRLDAALPLGQDWSTEASLGRRFVIGAPGLDLNNFWFGSFSLNYDLADRWSVGLSLDAQARSSSTGVPVLEIGPYVEYEVAPGWRLGAFAYRGFTRDSAEFGGGMSVTRRFRF